jgi:AcrR family transcriptional regulator
VVDDDGNDGRGQAVPRRRPWGTISRAQVVAAALDIVTQQGYESLTIRGLAERLGVAPMSLYRHVRDKEDLLAEVVDELLGGVWQPAARKADPRAWIADAADRLRRFLVEQPAALHVYLRRPVTSPAALARMEAMLRVLREICATDQEAQAAYAALHTYTVGFAALEAARSSGYAAGESAGPTAERLAAFMSPAQFARGLAYLLGGIEQSGA